MAGSRHGKGIIAAASEDEQEAFEYLPWKLDYSESEMSDSPPPSTRASPVPSPLSDSPPPSARVFPVPSPLDNVDLMRPNAVAASGP